MSNIDQNSIEAEAYAIYLAEGCPEGKALCHWLAAKERLMEKLTTEDEIRQEESEGGITSGSVSN